MRTIAKEDYVALAEFRSALRHFLRFAEEGARALGITPQQHQVLLAIKGQRNRDWVAIRDLAESLQLRHHATVGLVDRCQAAGLVLRSADPSDRRIVRVTLTEKGEQLLEELTYRNLGSIQRLGPLVDALREAQSANLIEQ